VADQISDGEAFAILIAHALGELYAYPCCPDCCWPCYVLKALSERPDGAGSLNSLLTNASPSLDGYSWYTDAGVDREWLDKVAFSRTSCHEGPESDR